MSASELKEENSQIDCLDNETTYHHDTLKKFLSEEFNKMSKDNDQLYAKCELTEANLFHYLRLLRSYLTGTNYSLGQQSTIINNPLYTTTTTNDCITHITAQTQYQQNNFNVTDAIVHHFAIEINDKLIQSTINNNNNIHPFLSLNKNIEKEFLFELNELELATSNLLNCWEMKSHEINYSSLCQQFFKVLLNFCMISIKLYDCYCTGEFDQFSNLNLNDLQVKTEQQMIDLSNELKHRKIQFDQFTEKLEQQQLEIDNNMKRKEINDQATSTDDLVQTIMMENSILPDSRFIMSQRSPIEESQSTEHELTVAKSEINRLYSLLYDVCLNTSTEQNALNHQDDSSIDKINHSLHSFIDGLFKEILQYLNKSTSSSSSVSLLIQRIHQYVTLNNELITCNEFDSSSISNRFKHLHMFLNRSTTTTDDYEQLMQDDNQIEMNLQTSLETESRMCYENLYLRKQNQLNTKIISELTQELHSLNSLLIDSLPNEMKQSIDSASFHEQHYDLLKPALKNDQEFIIKSHWNQVENDFHLVDELSTSSLSRKASKTVVSNHEDNLDNVFIENDDVEHKLCELYNSMRKTISYLFKRIEDINLKMKIIENHINDGKLTEKLMHTKEREYLSDREKRLFIEILNEKYDENEHTINNNSIAKGVSNLIHKNFGKCDLSFLTPHDGFEERWLSLNKLSELYQQMKQSNLESSYQCILSLNSRQCDELTSFLQKPHATTKVGCISDQKNSDDCESQIVKEPMNEIKNSMFHFLIADNNLPGDIHISHKNSIYDYTNSENDYVQKKTSHSKRQQGTPMSNEKTKTTTDHITTNVGIFQNNNQSVQKNNNQYPNVQNGSDRGRSSDSEGRMVDESFNEIEEIPLDRVAVDDNGSRASGRRSVENATDEHRNVQNGSDRGRSSDSEGRMVDESFNEIEEIPLDRVAVDDNGSRASGRRSVENATDEHRNVQNGSDRGRSSDSEGRMVDESFNEIEEIPLDRVAVDDNGSRASGRRSVENATDEHRNVQNGSDRGRSSDSEGRMVDESFNEIEEIPLDRVAVDDNGSRASGRRSVENATDEHRNVQNGSDRGRSSDSEGRMVDESFNEIEEIPLDRVAVDDNGSRASGRRSVENATDEHRNVQNGSDRGRSSDSEGRMVDESFNEIEEIPLDRVAVDDNGSRASGRRSVENATDEHRNVQNGSDRGRSSDSEGRMVDESFNEIEEIPLDRVAVDDNGSRASGRRSVENATDEHRNVQNGSDRGRSSDSEGRMVDESFNEIEEIPLDRVAVDDNGSRASGRRSVENATDEHRNVQNGSDRGRSSDSEGRMVDESFNEIEEIPLDRVAVDDNGSRASGRRSVENATDEHRNVQNGSDRGRSSDSEGRMVDESFNEIEEIPLDRVAVDDNGSRASGRRSVENATDEHRNVQNGSDRGRSSDSEGRMVDESFNEIEEIPLDRVAVDDNGSRASGRRSVENATDEHRNVQNGSDRGRSSDSEGRMVDESFNEIEEIPLDRVAVDDNGSRASGRRSVENATDEHRNVQNGSDRGRSSDSEGRMVDESFNEIEEIPLDRVAVDDNGSRASGRRSVENATDEHRNVQNGSDRGRSSDSEGRMVDESFNEIEEIPLDRVAVDDNGSRASGRRSVENATDEHRNVQNGSDRGRSSDSEGRMVDESFNEIEEIPLDRVAVDDNGSRASGRRSVENATDEHRNVQNGSDRGRSSDSEGRMVDESFNEIEEIPLDRVAVDDNGSRASGRRSVENATDEHRNVQNGSDRGRSSDSEGRMVDESFNEIEEIPLDRVAVDDNGSRASGRRSVENATDEHRNVQNGSDRGRSSDSEGRMVDESFNEIEEIPLDRVAVDDNGSRASGRRSVENATDEHRNVQNGSDRGRSSDSEGRMVDESFNEIEEIPLDRVAVDDNGSRASGRRSVENATDEHRNVQNGSDRGRSSDSEGRMVDESFNEIEEIPLDRVAVDDNGSRASGRRSVENATDEHRNVQNGSDRGRSSDSEGRMVDESFNEIEEIPLDRVAVDDNGSRASGRRSVENATDEHRNVQNGSDRGRSSDSEGRMVDESFNEIEEIPLDRVAVDDNGSRASGRRSVENATDEHRNVQNGSDRGRSSDSEGRMVDESFNEIEEIPLDRVAVDDNGSRASGRRSVENATDEHRNVQNGSDRGRSSDSEGRMVDESFNEIEEIPLDRVAVDDNGSRASGRRSVENATDEHRNVQNGSDRGRSSDSEGRMVDESFNEIEEIPLDRVAVDDNGSRASGRRSVENATDEHRNVQNGSDRGRSSDSEGRMVDESFNEIEEIPLDRVAVDDNGSRASGRRSVENATDEHRNVQNGSDRGRSSDSEGRMVDESFNEIEEIPLDRVAVDDNGSRASGRRSVENATDEHRNVQNGSDRGRSSDSEGRMVDESFNEIEEIPLDRVAVDDNGSRASGRRSVENATDEHRNVQNGK
ncbi:unnamed protein product [Schistosoma turkestanicum]|nr:unnamed protein product [Schistosoma turkestanicum]